jgi:hypothetical protein
MENVQMVDTEFVAGRPTYIRLVSREKRPFELIKTCKN